MKTFRLHLRHGLSAGKYEKLVERLGFLGRYVSPVKGGGRNLVVAIDVKTDYRQAAEHFAYNRVWMPGRRLGHGAVRAQVESIEELAPAEKLAEKGDTQCAT